MKIESGFMIREVAGESVVVPLGERVVELNGILTLSETGALLWKKLKNECTEEELVNSVLCEYNIDQDSASHDVKEFIGSLRKLNLLDE